MSDPFLLVRDVVERLDADAREDVLAFARKLDAESRDETVTTI